jgi:hypothetical protein
VSDKSQLKIELEPKRIMVTSEPYVVFTVRGYQAVVDVLETRTKHEYYLFVSARSLAEPLEKLKEGNNGRLTGLEFWIWKDGPEKSARYVVEE